MDRFTLADPTTFILDSIDIILPIFSIVLLNFFIVYYNLEFISIINYIKPKMSMNTYLINIINDVDDQNTRMKHIEADAIINNETVSVLQSSKQNLITVLTPVVCNTITSN